MPYCTFSFSIALKLNAKTDSIVFFVTFERGKKYAELLPNLRTHKDVLLAILHNHNLLVECIWPENRLPTISRTTETTVFRDDEPQGWMITFTNCEDGVSILDQGEMAGFTLHWRLTRADDGSTDVLRS